MSNTIATITFRAQGNRTHQTGKVIGRMGKKLLIDYTIKSGEGRQRWFAPSRYSLETLSVPFEDVPRYVAPVCKEQPDEAGAWAAGPSPHTWFCWKCGGEHRAESDWVPTTGDLGASYDRSLEMADAEVQEDNDQRAQWNKEEAARLLERPQMRPRKPFGMKPLPSTLHPTLESFVKACSDDRWMTFPTDQVPEWPGQETSFRVGFDGQYLVRRMIGAKSLSPVPRPA